MLPVILPAMGIGAITAGTASVIGAAGYALASGIGYDAHEQKEAGRDTVNWKRAVAMGAVDAIGYGTTPVSMLVKNASLATKIGLNTSLDATLGAVADAAIQVTDEGRAFSELDTKRMLQSAVVQGATSGVFNMGFHVLGGLNSTGDNTVQFMGERSVRDPAGKIYNRGDAIPIGARVWEFNKKTGGIKHTSRAEIDNTGMPKRLGLAAVAGGSGDVKPQVNALEATASVHHPKPTKQYTSREAAEILIDKITAPTLTGDGVSRFINRFAHADRPFAEAVLKRTSQNAHPSGVIAQLQGLARVLDEHPTGSNYPIFLSLDPHAAGGPLMYLMRKFRLMNSAGYTDSGAYMAWPDFVRSEPDKNRPIYLMDSIASRSLSPEEIALLSSHRSIVVPDLTLFEVGPNFTDFTDGTHSAAAYRKISILVEVAKTIYENSRKGWLNRPSLSHQEAAEAAISRVRNNNIDRLQQNTQVYQATMPSARNLGEVSNNFHGPHYSLKDTQLLFDLATAPNKGAADFLAPESGFKYFSHTEILKLLGKLDNDIHVKLASENIAPQATFLVINPSERKSRLLMGYLLKQVSHLQPEQFITVAQLNDMVESGRIGPHSAVVLLDDVNGTGSSIPAALLDLEKNPLEQVGKIIYAHLISYITPEQSRRVTLSTFDEWARKEPYQAARIPAGFDPDKLDFVVAMPERTSVTDPNHPLNELLQDSERGFLDSAGLDVFFHNHPDNTLPTIRWILDETLKIPRRR